MAHVQQAADGLFPVSTVIKCALIHIHPDELVCHLRIEVARELHGIGKSLFAMIERVLNAVAQSGRDAGDQFAS